METRNILSFSSALLKKGKELGADLVGIASGDKAKNSPSSQLAPGLPAIKVGLGSSDKAAGVETWPEMGKSVLVAGLSHPEEKPELDWGFQDSSPPGNKELIRLINNLQEWVGENYPDIKTYHPPYHVENGGIFLKDAAVWAGLGTIGKNNLLVTPPFGPRIRLRSLILDVSLSPTGPIEFDPCSGCEEYCLNECPRGAFSEKLFDEEKTNLKNLPGRTGTFSRLKCNEEMEKNLAESGNGKEAVCKFCRQCEFACPVGK